MLIAVMGYMEYVETKNGKHYCWVIDHERIYSSFSGGTEIDAGGLKLSRPRSRPNLNSLSIGWMCWCPLSLVKNMSKIGRMESQRRSIRNQNPKLKRQ